MARALSDDLRGRVLKASEEGASARRAAARFGVGISTAIRWIARRARLGETTAQTQGRRRASRLDAHEAFIVGLIEERRDNSLNEMMARLSGEPSVVIATARSAPGFAGEAVRGCLAVAVPCFHAVSRLSTEFTSVASM